MEDYILTATAISDRINCRRDLVNKALIKIGFLRKDEKGFFSLNMAGETLDGKEGTTYVKWHESILFNKLFLDAIDTLQAEVSNEAPAVKEVIAPKTEEVTVKAFRKTITATKIGEALNISGKDVNASLLAAGLMEKEGDGYKILDISLGEQKQFKEKAFVAWFEEILLNEVFLAEVAKLSSENTKAPVSSPKKEEISVEAPKALRKADDVAFKFDRKTFDAEYRAENGVFVRSRAELIVASWLYNHFFSFAYEKRLPIVEELYSDFYLNKEKLYIEVWGLESTKYLDRKAKKIKMYADNGYKMIGLDEEDIKNIDDFLPLKLAELGIRVD